MLRENALVGLPRDELKDELEILMGDWRVQTHNSCDFHDQCHRKMPTRGLVG